VTRTVRLPDVTGTVPARRMSVARGTLLLPADALAPDADALAAARSAAILAAKDAAHLLPHVHPFQATDATCDLDAQTGQVECTMTVQAFARSPLSAAALLGVSAALVALVEASGRAEECRIVGVQVVQNVVD